MAAGARRALIVATGNYTDLKLRRLRAPAADAQELAAVLEDPEIGDFAVDVALDAAEGELRRRIARFLREARRDDVLLLHVSCHGIKEDTGELYLAASDTEIDLPDATAISAGWLNERISRSPSRRILLLLDCCFSGRFPFGAQARADDRVNVQEHFQGKGHALISASNAMEYAYEGDDLTGKGRPSYFTQAVIDALKTGEADRDRDHWISVDELYEYVFDRVKQKTPNQTPTKQSALEGTLYVARSVYEPPVEPATLDEQLLALTEHPIAGARLGAVEELTTLLASPNKSVALAAQLTLERMVGDDSRRVAERAGEALAQRVNDTQQARRHDKKARPRVGQDAPTFEHLRELTRVIHEDGGVHDVAFSPDGARIATAGDDRTARVWEIGDGRELSRVTHEDAVNAVAFSLDGAQIATAVHLTRVIKVIATRENQKRRHGYAAVWGDE